MQNVEGHGQGPLPAARPGDAGPGGSGPLPRGPHRRRRHEGGAEAVRAQGRPLPHPAGGAYFVPREHAAFVGKVQALLGKLNGQLLRFPVPAGTREGDRSVREAVASGLAALVEEHRQAVEGFGDDTRADTLERAAERIRRTGFKVEQYTAYLAEEKGRLERELELASRRLWQKVEQITAGRNGVVTDPGVPSPR